MADDDQISTPPTPPLTGYAPLAVVERRHEENKIWQARHMEEHRGLDRSVMTMQRDISDHGKSLQQGSKTFAALSKKYENMTWSPWKIATYLLGGAGILFAAAVFVVRAPTRSEMDTLRGEVQEMKIEQALQREKIESLVSTQRAMNEKLDRLLGRTPP